MRAIRFHLVFICAPFLFSVIQWHWKRRLIAAYIYSVSMPMGQFVPMPTNANLNDRQIGCKYVYVVHSLNPVRLA